MTHAPYPPEFLAALVDTLLPGDAGLPSGSAACVTLSPASHRDMLDAIASGAGGPEAFVAGSGEARVDAVKSCADRDPAGFRALLLPLLQDYYEKDAVLTALGWRSEPPQTLGHILASVDGETAERLETVRRRGPIWRRC